MEKIAEIVHYAYEQKYCGLDLFPAGYQDKYKEFINSLNEQQYSIYFELDNLNTLLLINHERCAIRYILELIQPVC